MKRERNCCASAVRFTLRFELQLARANQRKISESARVSGLRHVDELLIRADQVRTQHLRVRTSFEHRADAAESILPHFAIAHVEEDRLIVLDLSALDVVGVDAQARCSGR